MAEATIIHGDLLCACAITANVILTTTTGESAQGLPEAGRGIICVNVIVRGSLSTQLSAKTVNVSQALHSHPRVYEKCPTTPSAHKALRKL